MAPDDAGRSDADRVEGLIAAERMARDIARLHQPHEGRRPVDLTPHFRWGEVVASATADRLKIDNQVPATLWDDVRRTAERMELVRALLGCPIQVTSWYRCPALNVAVGGSKTSAHMRGLAVDFQPDGVTLADAFERIAASAIPFDQLIHEGTRDGANWIHLGFSTGTPRREVLRAHGDRLGGPMAYTRVRAG